MQNSKYLNQKHFEHLFFVPQLQRNDETKNTQKQKSIKLNFLLLPIDVNNPFTPREVLRNLKDKLAQFAGRVKITVVPNIMNITYGRGVGYKIEQEVFDDAIHDISATKIREQMRQEGKL